MASVGPRARTSRLVTRDLGDELLVYDLERHKAYCLNRVAMEVFHHCDGETTIPDMALRIGDALGLPVDERAVRLGLVRLEKAHLLDSPVAQILHNRDHRSYVGASCQRLHTIRQPLHWSGTMLPTFQL